MAASVLKLPSEFKNWFKEKVPEVSLWHFFG
jgi:hypothetical protein